jgi:3-isopropylmalate/(R)-2-methylmalate dehydratase small subunit
MPVAWKIGDDINTDEIISCKHYPRKDLEKLGDCALEDVYPEFTNNCERDDVLIAGENFGCGSSREYAAIALKFTGIKCIIAKSFARIFYRNAINIGLPIIISQGAYDKFQEKDEIIVDLKKGIVENISKNILIKTKPLPEFILKIVKNNGIINFLQKNDFNALK